MSRLQNLFPVGLPACWQNQAPETLSVTLKNWLFEPSSLTARLKKHCQTFHVEVLGQAIINCSVDDACDVVKVGEQVLSREVILFCDNIPHIFARSLLPLTSLTGEQQNLANLGEQPLGQVIFNNPSLERKLIQVASFNAQSGVGQLAQQLSIPITTDVLWGRRSLFYLENKPLVVAEVFLPTAVAYQNEE